MELVKKFQYSLILFVIAITIFFVGLLPTTAKLLHRYVLAPEEYVAVTAVIQEISEENIGVNHVNHPVTVVFSVENPNTGLLEEQEALLDSYSDAMREGMEISIVYHTKNPQDITQSWTQIRDFFLYGAFTVLGVMVGMLMTKPASPEIYMRPRRSLRERLEKY